MTTKNTDVFGGHGGSEFTDTHDVASWGRITQIHIRHGAEVDAIATTYANGQYLSHGGTGGTLTTISLRDDEFITSVDLRSGARLDQITLHSSKGVTYGPYGGNGGSPHSVNFGDDVLQYFFGRSGARIADRAERAQRRRRFRSRQHESVRGYATDALDRDAAAARRAA